MVKLSLGGDNGNVNVGASNSTSQPPPRKRLRRGLPLTIESTSFTTSATSMGAVTVPENEAIRETARTIEPYYLDSDDEDDRPLSFKRSQSESPRTTPSTTVSTLAASAPAATVQEINAIEDPNLVEDNDDIEGVVEEHNQSEGEEELDEEGFVVENGEEEEMEDGEYRTNQEDDRIRGEVNGGRDMVGNESNSSNSIGSLGTKSSLIGTFTDPDVLDCPICCEALTVPVFQCDNGHLECSSCYIKIGNKCPSCSFPIGNNRCRAIERIINSVNFSCPNLEYGCKETMLHNKREVHEKTCIFAPCSCPLKNCEFVGSSKHLYAHFRRRHLSSTVQFDYERPFKFRLEDKHKSVILQEKTDDTIFILNQAKNRVPSAINLLRIGVSDPKEEFCYELSVEYEDSTLKLKSVSATILKWSGSQPLRKYLLVPSDFVHSNGSISVAVCIEKRRRQ